MKKFTSKEKIALMMGEDIIHIRESISEKDYKLIFDILMGGEKYKPYAELSKHEIDEEFDKRYDDIIFNTEALALAHVLNGEPIDLLKI
tara:strand:+ start:242 stop:508 length:267 start_codon:yes stop_codon:yes gene_type:complete